MSLAAAEHHPEDVAPADRGLANVGPADVEPGDVEPGDVETGTTTAALGDDALRTLHASLVLEEARLHMRYGSRHRLTSGGILAQQWDYLRHEIAEIERELARRGLDPTP